MADKMCKTYYIKFTFDFIILLCANIIAWVYINKSTITEDFNMHLLCYVLLTMDLHNASFKLVTCKYIR